jgi:HD-like signal output (HDOD) protein
VLHPKKAKDFIDDVAKETSLSKDVVENVISFYYRQVRQNLSGLTSNRVHLTNLGDFTIKHWKLDDKIDMLQKFEENNKAKGLQKITARYKTAESLYELRNLKKIIDEENQRKDFIKLHKTKVNVKSRKKHNKDMEKQESDS